MVTPDPNYEIRSTSPRRLRDIVIEWIKVIVVALLISLPIRFFIAEPFIVDGASMAPTFATGQFLVVDRLTYHFNEPKRGDVIVFAYPKNIKTYFIKRIIGLPGETVNIQNGVVSIIATSTGSTSPSAYILKEPYVEPIHASHDSYHAVIGDDQYFVMGDNRAESSDSRIWGLLDRKLIVGRPFVRLLPITTISFMPGVSKLKNQ